MANAGINFVLQYPEQFLAYIDSKEVPIYHKSNIFFRDFQYALWRFLQESQTKVSYSKMEQLAADVIDAFESRGIVRRINRQSFELTVPAFTTVFETAAPAPAAAKPKPAPAAPKPAAAAPAAGAAPAAASSGSPVTVESAKAMSDTEKAAKIAEIQARMADAKARRLAGG